MPVAYDEEYDSAGNLVSQKERPYDNDPLSREEYQQLRLALKALIAAPRTTDDLRLLARFILSLDYQPYDDIRQNETGPPL